MYGECRFPALKPFLLSSSFPGNSEQNSVIIYEQMCSWEKCNIDEEICHAVSEFRIFSFTSKNSQAIQKGRSRELRQVRL